MLLWRNLYELPYRKNRKTLDTWKIAVIILKLEQYHFTTELLVQMMQTEWQTV